MQPGFVAAGTQLSTSCADWGQRTRAPSDPIRYGFGERPAQDIPIRFADAAEPVDQNRLAPALRGESQLVDQQRRGEAREVIPAETGDVLRSPRQGRRRLLIRLRRSPQTFSEKQLNALKSRSDVRQLWTRVARNRGQVGSPNRVSTLCCSFPKGLDPRDFSGREGIIGASRSTRPSERDRAVDLAVIRERRCSSRSPT